MSSLVKDLFEVGALKFGTFKLKSGIDSPFYVDLRVSVSQPRILKQIAIAFLDEIRARKVEFDLVCGVPYTALPFATAIALEGNLPMVMCRKEQKDHGTRRVVEGQYVPGSRCLIIEDVVTSGSSILEIVESLVSQGLVVKQAVVLLDREQGGRDILSARGIELFSVYRMTEVVEKMCSMELIDASQAETIRSFLRNSQISPAIEQSEIRPSAGVVRTDSTVSPIQQRLYAIAQKKKSILCVAADVETTDELTKLAEDVGPHISVLKLHADIIRDWTSETSMRLREIASRHDFLLFEDRKFADIGSTVVAQFSSGTHQIASWADIINAHALPGPGVIDGLRQVCEKSGRTVGLLLVAQMSSKGNLIDEHYTASCLRMAREAFPFCIGFIAQERLDPSGNLFVMAPGVQLDTKGDSLGQQYNSPEHLLKNKGVDFLIVGRGVYASSEPGKVAERYKELSWSILHPHEN
jgi:uridine monophosphate synthetase